MRSTALMALGGAIIVAAAALPRPAAAQEWRRGDFQYFKEQRAFGPRCEYRIGAYGGAPLAFFGGARQARKAEVRAIRDWSEEASRLFGPQYGAWDLAKGKELHCDVKGLAFECVAAANPCKR